MNAKLGSLQETESCLATALRQVSRSHYAEATRTISASTLSPYPDFSGRGSTPDVAATSSAGPVAVFSPWIPDFAHPLQEHLPSAQGQVPVLPPHWQVVFEDPGTCSMVFSFSDLLPPLFPALRSAKRRASA